MRSIQRGALRVPELAPANTGGIYKGLRDCFEAVNIGLLVIVIIIIICTWPGSCSQW